jgi:hypothetical protein
MSIHSVGQSTLEDFSDKIHHRYKYTTQEGHFSPFPQSTSSNIEVVKVYTRKIESICYCGKPDVFQNMVDVRQNEVELSAVNGYTRVVQGFQGIGFVMNIVTVDSATCIDISIVSFLNE